MILRREARQHKTTELILPSDPVAAVVHGKDGWQSQLLARRKSETRTLQPGDDADHAIALNFKRCLPITSPADGHDESAVITREIEVRHHAIRRTTAEGLQREGLALDE